ncbi:MAG: hypothetical protein QGF67_07520 [Lentisphaeria bacterium]|jgi:hypothetical protein|nr:hypothetical protein [Lentisphaeria bacterium]MDP7741272.1 hypothetical protein [Lentisphaeria bacterium]
MSKQHLNYDDTFKFWEAYPVRERQEMQLRTFEYQAPFKYQDGARSRHYADGIIVTEDAPIVRVAVIGSACTPPGYVTLEGEPHEEWRHADEIVEAMPVRMRIDNLWGQHLRIDQILETDGDTAGRPYPERMPDRWREFSTGIRATSCETPLSGMSCAIFETPPCKSVRISGGSINVGWKRDNDPDDHHYSFRMIRTTTDGR